MAFLDTTTGLTTIEEVASFQSRKDRRNDSNKVPQPSHRHAAPSAPWPWMDLEYDIDDEDLETSLQDTPSLCPHDSSCNNCWTGYPQSLFPNWTHRQIVRSKIHTAIAGYNTRRPCSLYQIDIDSRGSFTNVAPIVAVFGREAEVWQTLRSPNTRAKVLFIENMSGPILQMLGTKYNMEPTFWSSALNWIPSRSQGVFLPGVGDHIAVTLTFLKSISSYHALQLLDGSTDSLNEPSTMLGTQKLDTQAPLVLYSADTPRILVLDVLSIYLIRNTNGSTIISHHPTLNLPTMSASFFHKRIRFAGQSLYWQNIFQRSPDPIFIFITFLWHALYAWDEALETLYGHICYMESRILQVSDIRLTQEFHSVRAHYLQYTSLLDDFDKHVKFIMATDNPMQDSFSAEDRATTCAILRKECENLSNEIHRLKGQVQLQEGRLMNAVTLAFTSINFTDSRYMREMTSAAVRDSHGRNFNDQLFQMKQIAYLTMIFLPATFVTGFFGMNVAEINPGTNGTLLKFFVTAVPLTFLTIWIVVALAQSGPLLPGRAGFFKRIAWPVFFVVKLFREKRRREKRRDIFSISAYDEDGIPV